MKRLLSSLAITSAILFGGSAPLAGQAALPPNLPTNLTFNLHTTHPHASKSGYAQGSRCAITFCPAGQEILDMEFTADGRLIAGYGDWNDNSDSWGVPAGRVGVLPYNVTTNTWEAFHPTGSEAHDIVRNYNGFLYLPSTDPSIHAPEGHNGAYSGFMTNDKGSWRFVKTTGFNMVHTFDVAVDDAGNYWVFGAVSQGEPSP